MKITVKDGRPSLRSLYKLIAMGWIIGFGTLFGIMFLMIFAISLLTGEMTVNGELVESRGQVLMQILPMLILFPIIIVVHAFMFGALIIGGMAIYRKRRPIELVDENGNSLISKTFD